MCSRPHSTINLPWCAEPAPLSSTLMPLPRRSFMKHETATSPQHHHSHLTVTLSPVCHHALLLPSCITPALLDYLLDYSCITGLLLHDWITPAFWITGLLLKVLLNPLELCEHLGQRLGAVHLVVARAHVDSLVLHLPCVPCIRTRAQTIMRLQMR